MNILGKVLFPAAVSATLFVSACGDSSSTSANVERGDDSSSSVEESSSSSSKKDVSSSSEKELPKDERVATLDDLEKNISLGKMFGTEVFLATGTKQGVFSIWIPDSAWIAVRSDFKKGVLKYGPSEGSFMGTGVASSDSLSAFFEKGGKFEFVVKNDTLMYSLNGGDYVATEVAKVRVTDDVLSDGSKLEGLKLACSNEDTSHTYSFYKGRFLDETKIGENKSWSAGYYDVQRSHLLMLPVFFDQPVFSLTAAKVKSSYEELTLLTGPKYKCKKSEFKYSDIDRDAIAGEWEAESGSWTLTLEASGKYQVLADVSTSDPLEYSGSWDVYGNLLLVKNLSCTKSSNCASSIKGVVEGFDAKKGFTYKHDDTGKTPLPEKWSLLKYE